MSDELASSRATIEQERATTAGLRAQLAALQAELEAARAAAEQSRLLAERARADAGSMTSISKLEADAALRVVTTELEDFRAKADSDRAALEERHRAAMERAASAHAAEVERLREHIQRIKTDARQRYKLHADAAAQGWPLLTPLCPRTHQGGATG